MPEGIFNSRELLNPGLCRADVWVVEPQSLHPEQSDRLLRVLSADERHRMQRFHYEQDRAAYLAAHGLKRFTLSSLQPEISPSAWSFVVSPHGRPEIESASGRSRWRFNLSHTRTLVACLITRDVDCGVDVEAVNPSFHFEGVGSRVLAPTEWALLAAASESKRPGLFYRFWTLKEAYTKALGLGMQLPFHQVAFELGDDSARLHSPSEGWHFEQWDPGATHLLAAAIRTSSPVRLFRHIGIPEVSGCPGLVQQGQPESIPTRGQLG